MSSDLTETNGGAPALRGLDRIRLEQFCANYAFGMPVTEALRSASYEVTTTAFGYSLLRREEARAMVDEHRRFIKEKLANSIEACALQLDRDREFAYATDNPGAAVNATMNKAKLLGYLDLAARGGEVIAMVRFMRPDEVEGT